MSTSHNARRAWGTSLVSLSALALMVPGAATATDTMRSGAGGNGESTLRANVAAYNVCGHGCLPTTEICEDTIGRDCATKLKPWGDSRAGSVAENVADSGVDIVATQEIGNNATPTQPGVDVESFRAPLTEAMESHGYAEAPADYAGATHPTKGYPLQSGAGRFTYYDTDRFSHTDEHGDDLPHGLFWMPDSTEIYGKTATWNVLRDTSSGDELVVVNVHLEFRNGDAVDPNGWERDWDKVRYNDAKRIIHHVTEENEATEGLPAVFAGDMNSDSRADGASPYDAFREAGFVDTCRASPNRHRVNDEYRSFNGGEIPIPKGEDENIDFVFAPNRSKIHEWRLHPETTADSGDVWDLIESDHNMIDATLDLPVRE